MFSHRSLLSKHYLKRTFFFSIELLKKVIKAILVSPCGTKLVIFDSCLLLLDRLFPLMDES